MPVLRLIGSNKKDSAAVIINPPIITTIHTAKKPFKKNLFLSQKSFFLAMSVALSAFSPY
jgi:hypothetical protein